MGALTAEPTDVYSEKLFEDAVIDELRLLLDSRNHMLIRRFGLDVAVFMEGDRQRLIEVKAYHVQRPGSIPFGNGKGEGPQVDLLLYPVSQLELLNSSVAWVFVDATQPTGYPRYALLKSTEAKQAARRGVARNKHNNFSVRAIMRRPLTWDQLSARLREFLWQPA